MADNAAYDDAEALGRMTVAELDAIRHCRICLEAYAVCVCKGRRLREVAESDA